MTTISLPVQQPPRAPAVGVPTVALIGNPNAGKTTLFNALTGLRAKTANFPGTTVEHRRASAIVAGKQVQLLDLPGLYSLEASSPEQRVARQALLGQIDDDWCHAVVLVLDATNLCRNLFLAAQVLELGRPTIVALTMCDLAQKQGTKINVQALAKELGCVVVPVAVPTRFGIDDLRAQIAQLVAAPDAALPKPAQNCAGSCGGCPYAASYQWAENVDAACVKSPPERRHRATERLDTVLTHPVWGMAAFTGVMFGVFAMIFWLAQYPMDWIDGLFAAAQDWVGAVLPAGDFSDMITQGVIGGVGGMLVFLPQICILFFVLSLLEDTGYLARVAMVMDRLMSRVGLPGKAFVPMLSAHACAIPAIMASRVIENPRDRLVTILVSPLLSCSARVPVYAMVAALLFPDNPLRAALLFTGAYALGIVAALGAALLIRRTVLPGKAAPLLIELPNYRMPHLRNAVMLTLDRGGIFVKKAGTVILLISVGLWAAATYPRTDPPAEAAQLQQQAGVLEQQGAAKQAQELMAKADRLTAQHALAHSVAGRVGTFIEPAIRPLGFDERIGVGLVASLAAREVIVSTLAVLYGMDEGAADEPESLYTTLREAKSVDGQPVFTLATSLSLLVFYVLAMQCLATQAVTRRETGSWKWPAFQFAYMTALAYVACLVTYQVVSALT
jgi:ferrous iron transport protein B